MSVFLLVLPFQAFAAIAFDQVTTVNPATCNTTLVSSSFTVANDSSSVFVAVIDDTSDALDKISSVQLDGSTAFTRVAALTSGGGTHTVPIFLYQLTNVSGTHTITINCASSITAAADIMSYKQSAAADHSTTAYVNAGAGPNSTNLASTVDNSWEITLTGNWTHGPVSYTGATIRDGSIQPNPADSNGPIHPAGALSIQASWPGGSDWQSMVTASFPPTATAALPGPVVRLKGGSTILIGGSTIIKASN